MYSGLLALGPLSSFFWYWITCMPHQPGANVGGAGGVGGVAGGVGEGAGGVDEAAGGLSPELGEPYVEM